MYPELHISESPIRISAQISTYSCRTDQRGSDWTNPELDVVHIIRAGSVINRDTSSPVLHDLDVMSILFALLLLSTITSVASSSGAVVDRLASQELSKANLVVDLSHALVVGLRSAFGSEDDVL